MNRFAAILLALALVAAAADARAGDGAAINVLGFSADGRYFAFEQYGEQDGSGSFYSTITAIEVAGDRPVKGMPVAATMDPDDPALGKEPRDKQLADIRAQGRGRRRRAAQAARHFAARPAGGIGAREPRRARMLEPEQVKTAMQGRGHDRCRCRRTASAPDTRLVLREFDIALPRCKDLVAGEHPNGFGLTLERKGRPTIHLSRDQTIPASRGCPDHYGIAEAHALPLPDGSTALAVVDPVFLSRRSRARTGGSLW